VNVATCASLSRLVALQYHLDKGVRFRKHPARKHGVKFDRYFVITYKWQGKTVSEAVGWASDGNKASEAYDILKELKHNQKTGDGR